MSDFGERHSPPPDTIKGEMDEPILQTVGPELTLDPTDWEEFKRLGHRMVDEMADHLAGLRELPTWQAPPDTVAHTIQSESVPMDPQGEEAVYEQFLTDVLPFPNGCLHPRFFGWVQGPGAPYAMMSDMLASGMNAHMAGYNQSPALVEKKVLSWFAEIMGFPSTASGILESGGTMGNILGLAVARHACSGFDVRKLGLQSGQPPVAIYCSSETHGWVQKGAEFLGIGDDWIRWIGTDAEQRVIVPELEAAIEKDLANGVRPVCVIGTAGTVNSGAFDDLNALADICAKHQIWFHVDGAFGALVKLSPKLAPMATGVERADSLAFDLHKWMYLPFEIACLLVRDEKAHVGTFAHEPSYISPFDRGPFAGGVYFSNRGIDLTRSFKALKAWMCIKAYGIRFFGQMIEQNVAQVQALVRLIKESDRLELLAPAPLNIACFRYAAPGIAETDLNALNKELLLRLQESGVAVPSSTVLQGKFALRLCIVNHRTRFEDIDILVQAILAQGDQLATEYSEAKPSSQSPLSTLVERGRG